MWWGEPLKRVYRPRKSVTFIDSRNNRRRQCNIEVNYLSQIKTDGPGYIGPEGGSKNLKIFTLRSWGHNKMRRTLTYWLLLMNCLVRYEFDARDLPKLKIDISIATSLMEQDFPLWFDNITTHILLHE